MAFQGATFIQRRYGDRAGDTRIRFSGMDSAKQGQFGQT